MKKVLILCGAAGSGKSHIACNLCVQAHARVQVVSADDHFVAADGKYQFDPSQLGAAHAECLRRFVKRVKDAEAEVLVVDNTNTTVVEIAPYAALALAYGWELEIHIIHASLETCLRRNAHNVPETSIQEQIDRLVVLRGALPPWWTVTESERDNAEGKVK